jgi:hypothetical protein
VTAPVVDTGNINLTSIPEIGPEEDIAINVSLSIKEQIQRGEYVDLSTLLSNSLMHESLNSQKVTLFQVELIMHPRHSPIHITSIDQWTSAFIVYIAIYGKAHPFRLMEFLRDMHIY